MMKYRTTAILILVALTALSGCISFTKPYKESTFYQIQYDPPETAGTAFPDVVMRIDAMNVAPAYQSQKILYSTGSMKRKAYEYHLWVVSPGDMLTELLVRDMIKSGLYMSVVDLRSSLFPQYELEGTIEQIYEKDEGFEWYAVLSIRYNFFAHDRGKVPLFQKIYSQTLRTSGHEPTDIVRAMGEAARAVSAEVQADANAAVVKYEQVKKDRAARDAEAKKAQEAAGTPLF